MKRIVRVHFAILALFILTLQGSPGRNSQDRGERANIQPDNITVGQAAPDFELPALDSFVSNNDDGKKNPGGKEQEIRTVKLSSFAGKKPVLLLLSSYT